MPDYRHIPSIEQLRLRDGVRTLERDYGRAVIVDALREAAATLRASMSAGDAAPPDSESAAAIIEGRVREALAEAARPSLRRVVNATGVVVHTNLGRSPLAAAAIRRIGEVAAGYVNLEYDVDAGRRGHRDAHAEALLQRLLNVEAAVVVNNNAAATLLMLAALAAGREVIVSRGELVEIGGGFRVPDVMAQSGARLREVGTTNRTRIADYRAAIGPDTALLLRVHRSNFRIEGFTEQPTLQELADLGRERGVVVAEDLGSGYVGLPGTDADARIDVLLAGEPRLQASLAAGIDVVCVSGDKLLGGPQAGIIVGRRDLVAVIRRHPLMRALRVDKLTYAALEATLAEYVSGRAARTVPVLRMILSSPEDLDARCTRLAERLAGVPWLEVRVDEGRSAVGGGTTPGLELPGRVITVRHRDRGPDWLDGWLRSRDTPIVGRIERDRLVLDLRTVLNEEDDTVAAALSAVPAA
jgi:L-seryl-tRNA(Ser) seleniumtransferase